MLENKSCDNCLAQGFCRSAKNLQHQARNGDGPGMPLAKGEMEIYLNKLKPLAETCTYPEELEIAVNSVKYQYSMSDLSSSEQSIEN